MTLGQHSSATNAAGERMKYGDRIYDTLLKRFARAGEFLPDGDVDVQWEDDGTFGQSKWHRCVLASSTSVDPRDYAYEHSHGGISKQAYEDDPKRLAFTLARYKHTAKLLAGLGHVLEVGCGDGYGSRIVRQHVGRLTAIDSDPRSIEEARLASSLSWPVLFANCDLGTLLRSRSHPGGALGAAVYDAVYALDVLEHISPDQDFLTAMSVAAPVAVIGTPSAESQQYASEPSRLGHVNCYSGPDLKCRLCEFWEHVFVLTMHDETLGTSFYPMAQYLLALCVGTR